MSELRSMDRAVHFDFHTNAGIDDFGVDFDAEKFASQMADANVGYVNIFGRCNMGYSYYPTEKGVMYPTLGGRDRLGDCVRECHKKGIGVTGYLHIGLDHELSFLHPEWLNADGEGRTYNFALGGNFFRTVCYNTGYAEHFIGEVKEILAYGVDGLFCDGFALRPCYCEKCLSDMRSAGVDITDKSAVTSFANSVRTSLMNKIRALVPDNVRLMFKGAAQWEGRDVNTHFDIAADDYDTFAASAAYARPIYGEVIYLGGRFQAGWGDFGGYKGRASVENDVYDSLMQGAGFMLGDHLHPARLPEADIYRDLGEIYGNVKKYEKWTKGAKFIADVAIITASDSLSRSVMAAGRMLSELKYGFDVINVNGDFSSYPLIILPDDVTAGPELSSKLKAYLENGGRIISSGISGLSPDLGGFALPEWGFEYLERDQNEEPHRVIRPHETCSTTYFSLNFDAPIASMQYAAYDTGIKMRAPDGAASLADEVDSYYEKPGYDGRHYVFYTPPRKKTGNSVLAINAAGNIAEISFKIFSSYAQSFAAVYRVMLARVLDELLPTRNIIADELPVTSRATLTGGEGYKLLHVKATYPEKRGEYGVIEEHNIIKSGKTVYVKGEYSDVSLLPNGQRLSSSVKNGYTSILLPEIEGYALILLK